MTSSKISIGIDHEVIGLESFGLASSAVSSGYVARVTQLLNAKGEQPKQPQHRNVVVPLGSRTEQIEVEPGFYGIQMILPSGRLLNQRVEVEPGGEAEASFTLGSSPAEWMRMQHLEGSIPEGKIYVPAIESGLKGLSRSRRGYIEPSNPNKEQFDYLTTRVPATAKSPMYKAAATESPSGGGSSVLVIQQARRTRGAAKALGYWAQLADTLESARPFYEFGEGLEVIKHGAPAHQGGDNWHENWRIPPSVSGDTARIFALVQSSNSAEIVSLPLPWPCEALGGQEVIELSVDVSEVNRSARTSVSVLDPNLFSLIAYLKRGSVALGRESLEGGPGQDFLLQSLQKKRANPLAAAAAAICLLGASRLDRSAPWHDWLDNLDSGFNWLPDGAVLSARRRLLGSDTQADSELAKDALLRAFRRGLPFYTLSLTWLLEGLRQFRDDAKCAAAVEAVRRVAVRADVGQAFTVLSVGPKPLEI